VSIYSRGPNKIKKTAETPVPEEKVGEGLSQNCILRLFGENIIDHRVT
jgi:hypothetical protein